MLFFSLLFGLIVGSFLNCLIVRLRKRKNIFGRSICPNCQHLLSFFDLIPIFSFFFLKGRCRYCQQKISWQYPLVELATGLLFLLTYLKLFQQFSIFSFQFSVFLLRDWLFIFILLYIFVYDLKYMLIEEKVVLPITGLIFLINFLFSSSLFLLLLGGVFGWGFFALQYFFTKGKGIGNGDLIIGLLLGLTLAWPKILVALVITYLLGTMVAIFLLLNGTKKLKSKIPLGPFLSIGGVITLFLGEQIINWYL